MTDLPTSQHINPCNQILHIMKYGVNRVTLVGNVSVTLLYRFGMISIFSSAFLSEEQARLTMFRKCCSLSSTLTWILRWLREHPVQHLNRPEFKIAHQIRKIIPAGASLCYDNTEPTIKITSSSGFKTKEV